MSGTSGLPPPSHRSRRAAVLVIDVISDFAFDGGDELLAALAQRTEALRRLLRRARRAGLPVIYVNDNQGRWDSDFPRIRASAARSSERARAVIAALAPEPQDSVILKPRHSAFYGSPLEALLEKRRISVLILTGVSAESCVWITACDAHTRGFRLAVPCDTMAGQSRVAITATLTGLKSVLGARTPTSARALRLSKGRLL